MRAASLTTLAILLLPAWGPAQTSPGAKEDEQTITAAKLDNSGPALAELFKRRAEKTADPEKIKAWIAQLGEKEAEKSDRAFAELVRTGMFAVPLLRQAANNTDEADTSTRARDCLLFIE